MIELRASSFAVIVGDVKYLIGYAKFVVVIALICSSAPLVTGLTPQRNFPWGVATRY